MKMGRKRKVGGSVEGILTLLLVLLFAIAVEEFVVAVLLKKEELWLPVLVSNLFTAPGTALLLTQLFSRNTFFTGVRAWAMEGIAVSVVILVEGGFCSGLFEKGGRSAMLAVLAANLASYGLGRLMLPSMAGHRAGAELAAACAFSIATAVAAVVVFIALKRIKHLERERILEQQREEEEKRWREEEEQAQEEAQQM